MLKNITLSADEDLIRQARDRAQRENTTLNAQFRFWLESYVSQQQRIADYSELIDELKYVVPGGKFNRDDMNER